MLQDFNCSNEGSIIPRFQYLKNRNFMLRVLIKCLLCYPWFYHIRKPCGERDFCLCTKHLQKHCKVSGQKPNCTAITEFLLSPVKAVAQISISSAIITVTAEHHAVCNSRTGFCNEGEEVTLDPSADQAAVVEWRWYNKVRHKQAEGQRQKGGNSNKIFTFLSHVDIFTLQC